MVGLDPGRFGADAFERAGSLEYFLNLMQRRNGHVLVEEQLRLTNVFDDDAVGLRGVFR